MQVPSVLVEASLAVELASERLLVVVVDTVPYLRCIQIYLGQERS